MAGKQTVSFGFSKTRDKKLSKHRLSEEETDYITSVVERKINSTQHKEEKKEELRIPLVLTSKWRHGVKPIKINELDDSLEAKAAREIIQETLEANGLDNKSTNEDISIPISIQNKISDANDKLDVSAFADESTLNDYDDVPVKEFGFAMLRGMGWKPGTPVGNTNKAIVKPPEPVFRPKGLGLGADVAAAKNDAKAQLDKENKTLTKGSCVQIQSGSHKGLYGKIEYLDTDNARLDIQLAIGSKTVSISEHSVIWISPAEYKEKAKVLNNESYEKFKIKNEEQRSDRESKRRKKRSRSRTPEKKKGRKYKSSDSDDSEDESQSISKIWVRPFLKVRFIDKKFKHGKYFNTKLVIDDVAGIDSCSCRMEDGRYLDEISQSWLETIVPRKSPAYVMVISGKYDGELGEILDRDKSKCEASVQLFRDRLVVKLDYDAICEYVGDITAAQDY